MGTMGMSGTSALGGLAADLKVGDAAVPARPAKEVQTVNSEGLAQMSLESLLYYVLAGDGKRRNEPAGA
jgi:hypothetical protein